MRALDNSLIASWNAPDAAQWNFESDGDSYMITADKSGYEIKWTIELLHFDEDKQDWIGTVLNMPIGAFCKLHKIPCLVTI